MESSQPVPPKPRIYLDIATLRLYVTNLMNEFCKWMEDTIVIISISVIAAVAVSAFVLLSLHWCARSGSRTAVAVVVSPDSTAWAAEVVNRRSNNSSIRRWPVAVASFALTYTVRAWEAPNPKNLVSVSLRGGRRGSVISLNPQPEALYNPASLNSKTVKP